MSFRTRRPWVSRLIGPLGAYPYLADFLTYKSRGGYKLSPRNVPATGRRRWARFGNEHFRLSAIPVQHGTIPAIAWRVEIGDQLIVFAGSLQQRQERNRRVCQRCRRAGGQPRDSGQRARPGQPSFFATPSQIGRVASQAGVRMLILGHRTNRTRGVESQSRAAIEAEYSEPLLFANDLECWGL